ncbi:MAG: pilus assembly protein [Gammaproteobacteria bacterium]|nr:pilus assembly protein [Gammaproteobacteria bacterium]
MRKTIWGNIKNKNRGQAMVEFVIAFPILIFLLFGIIEFARLTFAWMAVQNSARFGIRYAVTGEFNDIYCVKAGNNLGAAHINADVFGGDPQDCLIPDAYTGLDSNDKERELIDLARLFSIQDAAEGGGAGLWLEPAVAGNYEQYLANHDVAFIGQTTTKGYIHVTVCSNRGNQYAVDYNNYAIPLCMDNLNSQLMDDAGGPGDRVKVHIEHQHPLFLPLVSNLWPSLNLNAERDGIVEKFRTSRVIGVSGPILSAPTWTQTPTITDTPTITPTSSDTPTTTPSLTPTVTETPIPVDCNLISVEYSNIGHRVGGYYGALVRIRNNNPVPIHLIQANHGWEKTPPSRYLWAMQFNSNPWAILNDSTPATTWNPAIPVEMIAGGVGDYFSLFSPVAEPVQGVTSVDLIFDDGCHKGITADLPTSTQTATPTNTPTPTITPTPDCSRYSLGAFSFRNYAIQRMNIRNQDVVDANLTSLELIWDYAENYGAANGFNNLNVDWFKWANAYMPGHGQGGTRDYSSTTIWNGSVPFNAGRSYRWEIDYDGDWGSGGPLSGMINADFGVRAQFDNGCSLTRNPVPRAINTWTTTPTPTGTPSPSPLPPPTSTPLPSWTPLPSNTPPPSLTPTRTYTPSITPTPSDTPIPSSTPLPTNTALPPTSTKTPMPSSTSWPSATSPPPPTSTKTPLATNTPTPIPTWTPVCPFDDPNWPCQPTWTPGP